MDENFVDMLERELRQMRPKAPSPGIALRVAGRIRRRQARNEMLRSAAVLSVVTILAGAGGHMLWRKNLISTFRHSAIVPRLRPKSEIASDSDGAYMEAMRCSTRTFEQLLRLNRISVPARSAFSNAPWWRIIKESAQ